MSNVDWKELFFKYADHVGAEEGVDYLTSQGHWVAGTMVEGNWVEGHEVKWCTDEEWAAIQEAQD